MMREEDDIIEEEEEEDDDECHEATEQNVREYLMKEYGLSRSVAQENINAHRDILNDGIGIRSFEYYVGDKIMKAVGKDQCV